jgi:hypothetical protein
MVNWATPRPGNLSCHFPYIERLRMAHNAMFTVPICNPNSALNKAARSAVQHLQMLTRMLGAQGGV